MGNKVYLWSDQHGAHIYAATLAELRQRAGGGEVSKMFIDRKDGEPLHIGYVVGDRWFERFVAAPIKSK